MKIRPHHSVSQIRRRLIAGALLCLHLVLGASVLSASEQTAVVNINTANEQELALLPRVGPALAKRIVDFRKENEGFERPEDLMLVRGIGEKTYALMEPYVAVSGETTLSEKARPQRSSEDEGQSLDAAQSGSAG